MLDKIKDILTTINNLMAQLKDKKKQLEKMKSENATIDEIIVSLEALTAKIDAL